MVTNTIVERILNYLGEVRLQPKVYTALESRLQFYCNDRRFKLCVLAGTDTSAIFSFMRVEFYAFYDWDKKAWKVEYNK